MSRPALQTDRLSVDIIVYPGFKALEAIGPGLAEGPVWSKIQDALMANGWWT